MHASPRRFARRARLAPPLHLAPRMPGKCVRRNISVEGRGAVTGMEERRGHLARVLDRAAATVPAALGPGWRSVYLTGSAAAGRLHPVVQDVDLLFIVDAPMDTRGLGNLRDCLDAIRAAHDDERTRVVWRVIAGAAHAFDTRSAPTLADVILSPEEGILTFQQILAELLVNGGQPPPGSDATPALTRICDTFREQTMRNALRVAARAEAEASDVHDVVTALGETRPAWAAHLRPPDAHGEDRVEQLTGALERIAAESGIV